MSFTSGVSRWPDVYLATAARGLATCADFLVASTLALAFQSAGAGGLAVSGLLLAASLPLVALAPLTGRLADRVDSRILLVGAGLGQITVCLLLAYSGHPAVIIALVALLAVGLAVTQPTVSALVPAMVRAADLPRASALNQTAGTLGALAGPALAGLLVGQFGVRVPLLVAAAGYLGLVVVGPLIRTRRGGNRSVTPAVADGVASAAAVPAPTAGALGAATNWRLRRDPLLTAMVVTLAAVVAALGAINVIEIFYIRETLSSSTTMFGFVTGAWTAGLLAGAWIFARIARRCADDGTLVQAGLLLLAGCCLAVLIAAAVPVAPLLVPIWLVGGLCNGGDNVFNTVLMARRVPEQFRGRAFAAFGAAIQGAGMVGYLIGGLLMEISTPRPLFVACGLTGLLVLVVFAVPVRRAVRRERAAASARPVPPPDAGLATAVVAG